MKKFKQIAIIPARSGSKRIKRKNIKIFHNEPIISFSIRAALEAKCFDKIVVSTDDLEIKKVAEDYGAEVPFIRPSDLSDDNTGTIPVIAHAINWYKKNISDINFACCIYPTCPLLRSTHITNGLEIIQNTNASYVFTAAYFSSPIQRAFRINAQNEIEMFDATKYISRSQDLDPALYDAAQFYWGRSDAWTRNEPIFDKNSIALILPKILAQDINTEEDWRHVELLSQYIKTLPQIPDISIQEISRKLYKNPID